MSSSEANKNKHQSKTGSISARTHAHTHTLHKVAVVVPHATLRISSTPVVPQNPPPKVTVASIHFLISFTPTDTSFTCIDIVVFSSSSSSVPTRTLEFALVLAFFHINSLMASFTLTMSLLPLIYTWPASELRASPASQQLDQIYGKRRTAGRSLPV